MEYTYDLLPEDAVKIALKKKIPTLSFTYNEPTSFYEYVYDIAGLAKKRGLRILWHSNGGMNPEPLKELDHLLLKVVQRFPAPLTGAELADPRVSIEYLDGRFFIKKTPHRYDLVLVGISNPSTLQINRLFTKEFFSLVKERLEYEVAV
jgi:hypothetical protein